MTGSSHAGPQFYEGAPASAGAPGSAARPLSASPAPSGPGAPPLGLELFLASEASAVVEHTKQVRLFRVFFQGF
jgi:hypothetical protein